MCGRLRRGEGQRREASLLHLLDVLSDLIDQLPTTPLENAHNKIEMPEVQEGADVVAKGRCRRLG